MKVKNISNQKLKVVGIGVVDIGEEIEVPTGFNNANFVTVKKEKKVETSSSEEKVETKLKENNK